MSDEKSKEQLLREFEDRLADVLNETEYGQKRHDELYGARQKIAKWSYSQEYFDAVMRAAQRR
jgi:hypothetical protein